VQFEIKLFDLFYRSKQLTDYTGWSKKRHKVNDTIILQPYVI